MNTGRRISWLWAVSVACFLLFVSTGTAVAAAICYIPVGVRGEPGLGCDGSVNRYGVFKTSDEAYYKVKQTAIDNMTAEFTRYYAITQPQCPGVRVVPNDVPYAGLPYQPMWLAQWIIDICPQFNGATTVVTVWGVYTPMIKGMPHGCSDATVDRINAVCSEQQYTIKLSNDANPPASGDLAEVEPGKATTTLRATVYDNNNQPVPNIDVKLEVTVEAYSGGHQHNIDRPKGLLSNGVSADIVIEGNTGSGGMPFTFFARPPAGDHKIIATCTGGRTCNQEGPDKVWVGIRGLIPFTQPGSYVLVGFTPSHPANSHNLKPTVSGLVRALANVYRSRFRQDPVLHLNDASLERGGLFDSDAHKGKPWQPPHPTHRLGTDIDIRWNMTKHPTTSIPDANAEEFKGMVKRLGGRAIEAYVTDPDNKHFHVQFGGLGI